MRFTTIKCLTTAFAATAIVGFSAGAARAQDGMGFAGDEPGDGLEVRPPDPGKPDEPSRMLVYAAGVLIGAVVLGLAIMPSKRTHED